MCFIGSSTFGERFNPAKDCSDIVDNLPEAKDGFYWMNITDEKPLKVFCNRNNLNNFHPTLVVEQYLDYSFWQENSSICQ